MDAKQMMDEITSSARESGLSLSEYLRKTYDSQGLDDVQTVVKQVLSDNQRNIDVFRKNAGIKRETFDVTGLDVVGLDSLQAEITEELSAKREEYTGLCLDTGISGHFAQNEGALA